MYYAFKCVYVENGLKKTTRIRDMCRGEQQLISSKKSTDNI